MVTRQCPRATARVRAVHGAVLLGLLTAGCSQAAAAPADPSPAPAATATPDAVAEHAADTRIKQALLDCVTAAGFPLVADPATEQFGSAVAALSNSDPAAAAAITACQDAGLGPAAPEPDVPDDVWAEGTAANEEAFTSCMEGLGYHPQVDDSMTITGYGFAFTYPDDETTRTTFGADVGQCGDLGGAAQQTVIDGYLAGQ